MATFTLELGISDEEDLRAFMDAKDYHVPEVALLKLFHLGIGRWRAWAKDKRNDEAGVAKTPYVSKALSPRERRKAKEAAIKEGVGKAPSFLRQCVRTEGCGQFAGHVGPCTRA